MLVCTHLIQLKMSMLHHPSCPDDKFLELFTGISRDEACLIIRSVQRSPGNPGAASN